MMEWTRDLYRQTIREAIDSGEFRCVDPKNPRDRPRTPSEIATRRAQIFLRDKTYDLSGFSSEPGQGHWDIFQRFPVESFGLDYAFLEKSSHNYFFEDQAFDHDPSALLHYFEVDSVSDLILRAQKVVLDCNLTPVFHHPHSILFSFTSSTVVRNSEVWRAKGPFPRTTDSMLEGVMRTNEARYLRLRRRILSGESEDHTACAHCIWSFESEEDLDQHLKSHPDCMVFMVTHR